MLSKSGQTASSATPPPHIPGLDLGLTLKVISFLFSPYSVVQCNSVPDCSPNRTDGECPIKGDCFGLTVKFPPEAHVSEAWLSGDGLLGSVGS